MSTAAPSSDNVGAIVIDNKFGDLCQAGFAGGDSANVIFPSNRSKKDLFDDLKSVYGRCFSDLSVDASQHPVLLSESPINDKANQERVVSIMFDTFNVPAMFMSNQSVLSLYATGKHTGCVLDSNESSSYIVPVVDGYGIKAAFKTFDVTGNNLTDYMMKLLNENDFPFKTQAEHEIVRDMKSKLCYVASDFEKEKTKAKQSNELEKEYELPDRQKIKIKNELCFHCPEIMFKPHMIGRQTPGVHQFINDSIMICDEQVRQSLYQHIVLSGSNTMFDGIVERLSGELRTLVPSSSSDIAIVAPPERKYTSWIGGSMLAGLESFQQMWITKREYQEFGPQIINKKL